MKESLNQSPTRADTLTMNRVSAAAMPQAPVLGLAAQTWMLRGWLIFSDALVLLAAFRAAYWVRFDLQLTLAPDVVPDPAFYPSLAALFVPLWLATLGAFGLYDGRNKLGGIEESSRAFNACSAATMLVIVATFFMPAFVLSRLWLMSAWFLSFVAIAGNRFVARRIVYASRRVGWLLTPAVIVGTNEEAETLARFLADWRLTGVRLVGFVPSEEAEERSDLAGLRALGRFGDVRSIVERHGVQDVIVAITGIEREQLLWLCEELDSCETVSLRLSSGLYELLTTRLSVRNYGTVPLLRLDKFRLTRAEAVIKALIEYPVTVVGLLVLSPLFLAIAALIKLDSPGPIFHRRRVLGVSAQAFDAFKFRTMHVDGDAVLARHPEAAALLKANHKLKDDPRVTRVGQWLRRYSLDELPQLINVMLGQMGLVGPRMIAPHEADMYGRHRLNLLTVKPGITGLWQVSGRSDLTYDERVQIDMLYVRNYSIWLDLQILFIQTIPAVLRGRGAY
ncbi:MAG: sugar transferase [Vicinamibacterales bacterium]